MNYVFYLFLSVAVLFTSPLFAEVELKKELGVCGKTMTVVFRIFPAADPDFTSAFKLDEEFCDYGRYEENANYIISLYDDRDQLVYDKRVYINPINVVESDDPKRPGKLEMVKIEKAPMSRIVKFPLPSHLTYKSYLVKSIKDQKTYAKKIIKW